MAKPTLNDILLGGFAYFLESGTTVDSVTVAGSSAGKPDNNPTTNWTDATLGDVLNFKFEKEEVDVSYQKPLASGGYAKVNRKITVQDSLILKTRQMGELVHRLEQGLAAAIATGTAQEPGAQLDRKVTGWLRLQGRQLAGTDRFIMDWWCEVRLESSSEFNEKVAEPVLRFTLIKGTEGNSINFPSGS